MSDFLLEIAKASPQSVAVVIVIIILIKYLERRDRLIREYDQERESRSIVITKAMNDEHIYAREQAKAAIDRNTAIMERNVSATDRNTFMVDTLSKTLQDYLSRNVKHNE